MTWKPDPWSPVERWTETEEGRARIRECVNALAGVEDPQAYLSRLRRVETAARLVLEAINANRKGPVYWTGAADQLRDALAPQDTEDDQAWAERAQAGGA